MTSATQSNTLSSSLLASVNGTGASGSTSSSAGVGTAQGTQDQFLKLLTTQMQNQDPLNPMDNSQMTSQLAQISTVNGVDQLNTTLKSLVSSFQSNQSLQAAAMIGHSVLVPGSDVVLGSSGGGAFGADLPKAVDSLTATISDASGRVIRTLDLGAQKAGSPTFQWDGLSDSGSTAAVGSYTVKLKALQGGQDASADPLAVGNVTSVSTGSAGARLNVSGVGAVSLADVRQVM